MFYYKKVSITLYLSRCTIYESGSHNRIAINTTYNATANVTTNMLKEMILTTPSEEYWQLVI